MKRILVSLITILIVISLIGCSSSKNDKTNDEYNSKNTYLGINLSSVSDSSTEYPFKDIFKMTRNWRTTSSKDVEYITDENGWITDLNGNSHAVAFLANQYLPIGDYVMTYDGSGDITFDVKNGIITNEENGRIEFTINEYGQTASTNHYVQINSIADDYIKNIKIFESKYEDNLDDIFNPDFLENISIFHDIRFMDFMDTNNSEISEWNDRPKVDDHTYSTHGVPLEVMVELCNKIKANPWFCMPHKAADEYVEEFATYVNNNLDSNLTVYLENSNETWNGIFTAQSYNLKMGNEHDNIKNKGYANWQVAAHYYAQRSVEMFKIWDEHYNNDLVKVLATQSSNYGVGTTIMKYELKDGTIAANYADVLSIAPYIGNSITSTNQSTIFEELNLDLDDYVVDIISNKQNAEQYNLDIICYEAGQHLAQSNIDSCTEAFIEANSSIEMGNIYTKYLDLYKEHVGGKMFLFSSTSNPSKYGSWGLLEYQNQDKTNSSKYKSVNNWIVNNLKT